MNNESNEILTPRQVAKMLEINLGTLAQWRYNNRVQIPYFKCGKSIRYRLKDIREWADRNTRTYTREDENERK